MSIFRMNCEGDPIATATEFHNEIGPHDSASKWEKRLVYGLLMSAAGTVFGLMGFVYLGIGA